MNVIQSFVKGCGSRWSPRRRDAVGAALIGVLVLASVTAVPAATQETDTGPTVTRQVVESFDGTPIVTNLFVPAGVDHDHPAPLVLRTHGWGGSGQQDAGGFVGQLLDAGYIVLTWDQRGFGCSGGVVHIDKPDPEGRDVRALIDWAVANAPVEQRDGDPVVGMTGGSYAGGIQPAVASIDSRIDALAPEVSWSDLRYTLYSGRVVNQGWALLLAGAGLATTSLGALDPSCPTFPDGVDEGMHLSIYQGLVEGATTGQISNEVLDFLGDSSLAVYGEVNPVAVPTLVIQGSTDTLFDLTDGYGIVEHVTSQDVPARFMIFCGGHVACPEDYGDAQDRDYTDAAVLRWFARYLRGDEAVDVGPPVEYRTNDAQWRAATGFPPPDATWLDASGTGSLISLPVVDEIDVDGLIDAVATFDGGVPALPITSGQITDSALGQSMRVEIAAADTPLEILGIPRVSLDVSGPGTDVILMAKLIDREANRVINLQEGAVRVPLNPVDIGAIGSTRAAADSGSVQVPMPGLAYTLPAGHHLDLEVSTASLMHQNARLPAVVDVKATVTVPIVPPVPSVMPIAHPDPAGGQESAAQPGEVGRLTALPRTGGWPNGGAIAAVLVTLGLLGRRALRSAR